jgi:hypothetical protein
MSPEPKTFVESRLKAVALVLGGVALCALGVYTALQNWQQWPLGLLCVALGLGGVALGATLWTAPLVLKLDHEGFVLSGGLFRQTRQYAWRDIDRFYVWSLSSPISSLVAFNLLPGRTPQDGIARSGHGSGAKGVLLPAGWPISTRHLVEYLNAYLEAVKTAA